MRKATRGLVALALFTYLPFVVTSHFYPSIKTFLATVAIYYAGL
jgi:hypothetical protein